MEFSNFGEIIEKINSSLKDFTWEFINERKRLAKLGRRPKNILFAFDVTKGRNWAINEGGGTEIQYHLAINPENTTIYLGLGFNTQYVQFANEKSMPDYARPFMQGFLQNEQKIRNILPDYFFVIGDIDQLSNPQNDQYTLFGKEFNYKIKNEKILIDDKVFENIKDSLITQFEVYKIIFESANTYKSKNHKMDKKIELLEYKKQIILQGPPGTGKTREAKLIAKEMLGLSEEFIQKKIHKNLNIYTVKGQASYLVLENDSQIITLQREKGTSNTTSYAQVISAFSEKKWNNEIDNNDDRMAVAIAKYLYDNFLSDNDQFKLVQFHPSYTYEDFVRGIIALPSGNSVIYESANKILGKFAKDALNNYTNSKKSPELISKESWVAEKYELFKDSLRSILEDSSEVLIKSGIKPKIIAVEDDSLRVNRYSNENDSILVKDNDIILAYIGLELSPELIKIRENINLSKSARSGMSYVYQNLVTKFKDFLIQNSYNYIPSLNFKTEQLRKYIFIIDEINRANLSSVLGELIYALEYREKEVESMYEVEGSQKLILPPNIYIIGTMNTADRSVGHIDYAIRRRFAFVDVLPKNLKPELKDDFKGEIFAKVASLFIANYDSTIKYSDENVNIIKSEHMTGDFDPKDVWLGHSYFIQHYKKDENGEDLREKPFDFRMRIRYEIKPILEEYIKDGILKESARDTINTL